MKYPARERPHCEPVYGAGAVACPVKSSVPSGNRVEGRGTLSFSNALCCALVLFAGQFASGHEPPVFVPVAPLHVQGAALVDSANTGFVLRGVQLPGLNLDGPAGEAAMRAMTPLTFRLIQQRWNTNAVRLPVSIPLWRRDGQPYLDKVAAVV